MTDDATVLTRMDFDTLVRIRHILAEFQILSGLACNVEKTMLMQFGSNEPVPQNILELGFDVKNELKLLGLKIESNCSNYAASKNDIEEKFQYKSDFGTGSILVYQVEYQCLKHLCILSQTILDVFCQ